MLLSLLLDAVQDGAKFVQHRQQPAEHIITQFFSPHLAQSAPDPAQLFEEQVSGIQRLELQQSSTFPTALISVAVALGSVSSPSSSLTRRRRLAPEPPARRCASSILRRRELLVRAALSDEP